MPFIKIKSKIGHLTFLIDSGASISTLNPGLCQQKFIIEKTQPIIIKSVGGNIKVNKYASIPKEDIFLPICTDRINFLIMETKNFDGIIGNNVLKKNKCRINYETNEFIMNTVKIPLFYDLDEPMLEVPLYLKPLCVEKETPIEINFVEYCNRMETTVFPEVNLLENRDIIMKNVIIDHLNGEEIKELKILLHKNADVFYKEGTDLSFTHRVKHIIPTLDDKPVYSRTYRYPISWKEEIDRQVSEMLEQGIIRHSNSPYNSSIVMVKKKPDNTGKKAWRFAIDYKRLNINTREDKYPIPRIDDLLDKLGRSQYFTTLDLTKGYMQVEMDPASIEKTAFSTADGHYEFLRMPFGLKNAPATFQRLMNEVLHEHLNKICLVYLDDIIIFSTTLEEHVQSVNKVFKTLRAANLKVQITKSEFFKKETKFLGHIVTADGIKPNPEKLKAIENLEVPKKLKDLQAFLGITGYYRRFIKDYAKIAKPMTLRLKRDKVIDYTAEDYIEAFNKLKNIIKEDVVLAYPDVTQEFVLTTDASNYAIGAVLSQKGRPISFGSRTLNQHEINYSTIEKELLAIVWGTKMFRHYLYGVKFKIETDHRPLVWLTNFKEPNGRLIRWKIKLSEYNFEIIYIKGKENHVADALSRLPITENLRKEEFVNTMIACHVCKKLLKRANINRHLKRMHKYHITSIERYPLQDAKVFDIIDEVQCHLCKEKFFNETALEWHKEDCKERPIEISITDCNTQHSAENDDTLHFKISGKPINLFKNQIHILVGEPMNQSVKTHGRNINVIKRKEYGSVQLEEVFKLVNPTVVLGVYTEDIRILNAFQNYYISKVTERNEIYYAPIKLEDINSETEFQRRVEENHKEYNHPGVDKTYEMLKKKIYYPKMKKYINAIINECEICQLTKYERNPVKLTMRKTLTPTNSGQIVSMDIWIKQTNEMYLSAIDRFSKYVMMEKIESRNTTDVLKSAIKILNVLGYPKVLIVDNEGAFENFRFTKYLRDRGTKIHYTTPERHTGNSDIERFHNTLKSQLIVYQERTKRGEIEPIDAVQETLEIYNKTIHSSTGYTPYELFSNQDIVRDKKIFLNNEKRKRKQLKEYREKEINLKYPKARADKLNKNRHQKKINNPHLKVIRDPKLIDVNKYQLDMKRRPIYYKDQFCRQKKSKEEIFLPDNITPGNSSSTNNSSTIPRNN